jgi:uncharacterized membrane protein YeaQ/YmgE (transglycosylase-associated protein family)
MGVIGWIVFGLIVMVVTALLGIVGALLGGFLGRTLGWYREGDPEGFVMAVIGSIVLLVLFRLVAGRSARSA